MKSHSKIPIQKKSAGNSIPTPKRTENICSHKNLYTHTQEHCSQQQKRGNKSNVHQLINGWAKCGVSLKQHLIQQFWKEVLTHATWMNLKKHAKWKQPDTKGHMLYDFVYRDCLRAGTCVETESRLGLPGAGWVVTWGVTGGECRVLHGVKKTFQNYRLVTATQLWIEQISSYCTLSTWDFYGTWIIHQYICDLKIKNKIFKKENEIQTFGSVWLKEERVQPTCS